MGRVEFESPTGNPRQRPFIEFSGASLNDPSSEIKAAGYWGGVFEVVDRGPLTNAQHKVFVHHAVGLRAADIARSLGIYDSTMRTHNKQINKRVGSHTVYAALAEAFVGNDPMLRTSLVAPFEEFEFNNTEKDVLTRLSFGGRIIDVARERGTAVTTVRSQLKTIYKSLPPGMTLEGLVTLTQVTDVVFDQEPGPIPHTPLVALPIPQVA